MSSRPAYVVQLIRQMFAQQVPVVRDLLPDEVPAEARSSQVTLNIVLPHHVPRQKMQGALSATSGG